MASPLPLSQVPPPGKMDKSFLLLFFKKEALAFPPVPSNSGIIADAV
jgi:hypothetical protein